MRYLLTLAFLCMFLPAALAAKKSEPLPDSPTIEAYLNSLSTLKSRFVQTDNDGKQVTGTFLLKRPGRLRFEYDPPVKDFIVADGLLVHYYDEKMKQQSSIPISKSLADFFLRAKMQLSGDIAVSGIARMDGLLQLTLTQSKDPLAGSLTLLFGEKPLQLQKWRIVDAQGLTTTVALYDTQSGIDLNGEQFHYYDPENKKSFTNK
ncbi:MAG: outer membrane lipoprotein carrier protein LolA [Proteobacteria bacterium]|nr:outer membrane lipoprotein carrier protein LolA [Pseudomonadota bacterium]